jgi:hypothetical protein
MVLLLDGCVVATSSSDDGGGGGGGFFFLFVPFALIAVFTAMVRGRGRRRRRREEEPATVNPQLIRAELSVLADDVVQLEPQVALKEEARADYEAATHRYRVATAALEHTDAPLDLARLQRVVDEGTWSMARARAILNGHRPPEPPSTLQQPGPRGEPAITLGDGEEPVYADSRASFRSGWFGAGGGLFGGLILGSMMGGLDDWTDDGDAPRGSDDSVDGW